MTHSSQVGLASLRHGDDWKTFVATRAEQDTRNRFALTRIEHAIETVPDEQLRAVITQILKEEK